MQIKPVIAERDLVAEEPVADLAPALLEERCILSHGNCVNVEISASMSTVSRTDSAVRGGSSIKQVSTHMHAVLSHHTAVFFFFFNSAGCFSRQAGVCVQWSEEGEEPARWWRPSCSLALSAAAVGLTGALISLCSQSGSHGWQERGEAPMGPSQHADSSREAEPDNRDHRRRQRLDRSLSLYRANLWL